jgi:hypothetical protein
MHTAERLWVPDLRTLVRGFRIHHEVGIGGNLSSFSGTASGRCWSTRDRICRNPPRRRASCVWSLRRAEGPRRRPRPGSVNTYQVSRGSRRVSVGAPETVNAEILWADELRPAAKPGISTVHLLGLSATQVTASAGLGCTYQVFRGTAPLGRWSTRNRMCRDPTVCELLSAA